MAATGKPVDRIRIVRDKSRDKAEWVVEGPRGEILAVAQWHSAAVSAARLMVGVTGCQLRRMEEED